MLYVDGTEIITATQSYTGSFAPVSAGLGIGHLESNARFTGTLDEVAIYTNILPEREILTHYYLARGYNESCSTLVNIMPLGDSITRGYGSGSDPVNRGFNYGYRLSLFNSLSTANFNFDFVGSQFDGQLSGYTFDYDHEGWGGFHDEQIANNVQGYLTDNPADIVLLHIGTNDIAADPSDNSSDQVERILDDIDNFDEAITVILARIVDQSPNEPSVTVFNNNVEAMAQNRITNGDKIIIVDQQSALNYVDDVFDLLHPNEAGYEKMADVWFDALDDFLPVCITPVITSTPVAEAVVGQPYTYDVEVTGVPTPTLALLASPDGMTIDSGTGIISWTPAENQVGSHAVEVEASNSFGNDTQPFTIVVNGVPTIISSPITEAIVGQRYIYDVDATGFPNPIYTLFTAPAGMAIDPVTGIISWTPVANQSGSHTVEVEVSNSAGTDSQSFTIDVNYATFFPIVFVPPDPE
jgi:lysophospholipase L1-like esterase